MDKKQVLKLVAILGQMKLLKRQGWINRRIREPESDAEHSFSMAVLVMLTAPKHLDMLKCVKMALIHDLPEVVCGDHVPGELSPKEKYHMENEAMQQIVRALDCQELGELFAEFMQGQTAEARFVKALDGLDNVFTARFYEQRNGGRLLTDEFAANAYPKIMQTDEDTQNILLDILKVLA
jgi:putative hydrolase of HD superfamily